jgi:hypothetical protein
MAVRDLPCWLRDTPSIRKSWYLLRLQAEIARSVLCAHGFRPRSLFCLFVIVFWFITLCSLVGSYRHVGRTFCLYVLDVRYPGLLRGGLYRWGEGNRVVEEKKEPIRVGDVDAVGWWRKCWLLNHNLNLQHSENFSAVWMLLGPNLKLGDSFVCHEATRDTNIYIRFEVRISVTLNGLL